MGKDYLYLKELTQFHMSSNNGGQTNIYRPNNFLVEAGLLLFTLLLLLHGVSPQSCPSMPASLSALGYEEQGGKFYRLYRWGDIKKHNEANKVCQDAGARLAMFKTQAEFDIVKQYKG